MEDNKLSDDKIRKIIWGLNLRRDRLQKKLSYPKTMIEGCLHVIYKKCGNPNCKCQKGKKHGPYWALSKKEGGKRKVTYLQKIDDINKVKEYQKYNRRLASIRKINEKIFYWLKILRDRHSFSYEK
jgi:hypothetical protein